MYSTSVKLLSTEQTTAFDEEYVCDELFKQIKPFFEIYTQQKAMTVLDVGGGNGVYADRLLHIYTNSEVTVLEPDNYLLSKNKPHTRKQIIQGTFQDTQLAAKSYDVIQFNWVLHHFVTEKYAQTRAIQLAALREARRLLKPGGRIIILENFYDGLIANNLPGRLIFELTANQVIAPLIKYAGANTAGVGVCFNSKAAWQSAVSEAGFVGVQTEHCYDFSELSTFKRLLLGIKQQHVGLIVAH